MRQLQEMNHRRKMTSRAGVASLDYVLILAYVVVPVVFVLLPISRTIMGLAYEMVCALVAWPFM